MSQLNQENIEYNIPVVLMNKMPIPNTGEQIFIISKESSIVSFIYSELFCSKYIVIAIKKDEFKKDEIQNIKEDNKDDSETNKAINLYDVKSKENLDDKEIQYSGVLCKILDKVFDEGDDSLFKKENNLCYKLKVLLQTKIRVKMNDIEKESYSFQDSNFFFPEKRFTKENLIFSDQLKVSECSEKSETSENFFYMAKLSENNVEDFNFLIKNISLDKDKFKISKDENISEKDKCEKDRFISFPEKYKVLPEKIKDLEQKYKNYCISYAFKSSSYESILLIQDDVKKIDIIASKFNLNQNEFFEFFKEFNPNLRIDLVLNLIQKEVLKNNIDDNIDEHVKKNIEKTQKIYLLSEKAREVSKQLEEIQGEVSDLKIMEDKLNQMNVSDFVKKKIRKEINRLKNMNQGSSDASVVRNYLDLVFDIPFGINDKLNMSFSCVSKALNQEHYGMEKVKDRILQYLAVEFRGGITPKSALLLVGPPGVGKTSLSRKIAQALGRKFVRISLGGVRDEADIRGHRKTYLGAMPGKIAQALKDCGSANPLILLDEIDKVGSDMRGDPASALLEVLDREQNDEFLDHYLDIPIDLSKILFICTANGLDRISRPLLDRMEIIWVSSYSGDEKIEIANNYMIPEQLKAHNLKTDEICFDNNVVEKIIKEYTYEAGVRGLEEQISIIMRKSLLKILNENISLPIHINNSNLIDFLGLSRFTQYEDLTKEGIYGVANGLAWNEAGGSVLTIECVSISLIDNNDSDTKTSTTQKKSEKENKSQQKLNEGSIKFTGKLGDVMQESIQIAFSYIKANKEKFGVNSCSYKNSEIHVHVPEGATPKDGPSAGITIFSVLLSLLLKKPLNQSIAMTGEITLTGRVLPIGGLKEKILAAKKHNLKYIIIPKKNQRDLDELPSSLKDGLEIHLVETAEEVFKIIF